MHNVINLLFWSFENAYAHATLIPHSHLAKKVIFPDMFLTLSLLILISVAVLLNKARKYS